MRVLGIVAEYNPFHNGHLYQLTQAKKDCFADACVVCMSGNYTQRGDFSLIHKKSRAEAAIRCGADLVIELPLSFAVSSAEKFAFGAIFLLSNLCQFISCGCETATSKQINQTAELLLDPLITDRITGLQKSGISFAQARQKVITDLHPELGGLLSNPNDNLAVEYQKAIFKLNADISLIPILRQGPMHGSTITEGDIASAGYIRDIGYRECRPFLPIESYRILEREENAGRLVSYPSDMVLSYLRHLKPEQIATLPDVREGLEYRIYNAVRNGLSLDEILSLASSKRYTKARIRRILLSAYLNIDQKIAQIDLPPYMRILGMNQIGQSVLHYANFNKLPVISRSNAIDKLPIKVQDYFRHECLADDLYTMAYPNPEERLCGSNQRLTPYIGSV